MNGYAEGDFLDPDAQVFSERVYVATAMKAEELRELLHGLHPDDVANTDLDHMPGTSEPLRKGYSVLSAWWD